MFVSTQNTKTYTKGEGRYAGCAVPRAGYSAECPDNRVPDNTGDLCHGIERARTRRQQGVYWTSEVTYLKSTAEISAVDRSSSDSVIATLENVQYGADVEDMRLFNLRNGSGRSVVGDGNYE